MHDPEEAGKYRVENQQVVQGQVIGDYATVHIHHTPPQSASTPPPASPDPIWNVPFARNPFFTGREELLERLHTQLHTIQTAALGQPQAISGLGGIGKTQLAIEYTHRYGQEYQAVLWARANTTEALNASYTEIAGLLQLPQKDAQEQEVIIQAVKGWLSSKSDWLLILDNADELPLLQMFLPTRCTGHLLLTTRVQATGAVAQRLEIVAMDEEAGALLLLRRAGLVAPTASLEAASSDDLALAKEITQEMGGLPLALDQAGAYIEETACGLKAYQQQYQAERARLLARRGGMNLHHPEPVATTWALSFQKVEAANPTAAELLRICAFLAPDAIPEELLMEALKTPLPSSEPPKQQRKRGGRFSWSTPGRQKQHQPALPAEAVDEAVALLRTYSLLTRNPQARMLSVHRLVQTVLQDMLKETKQRSWRKRIMLAINTTFPHPGQDTWSQCERLLPHALLVLQHLKTDHSINKEASHLSHEMAIYFLDHARYAEAEPLFQQALHIREQLLGPDHPDVASSLNALAVLCKNQDRYAKSESLFQRALHIREQQLGLEHPDVAQSLNGLAELYRMQSKYAEAEPLYQRALHIWEQQLGPEHPQVAYPLNNLAILYVDQGKYEEAELLYQRALSIREQQLGPEHSQVAYPLHGLAVCYGNQGRYEEAEPLYQRALHIWEQQLGPEHPQVAYPLSNLAELWVKQGRYEKAEPLYQRALHIWEQQWGPEHSLVSHSLSGLANLYREQGKYVEAEPLYVRALAICEQTLGRSNPDTQTVRRNYAILLRTMGRDADAENLEPEP